MDIIKKKIKDSINLFKVKDWDDGLSSVNIYEPTICHRIAVYLEYEFYKHNVDCEYNKDGYDAKRNKNGKKIRPDIIIHRRTEPVNLAVFELKKCGSTTKLAQKDIEKLRDFLSGNYFYTLGVFIGVLKTKIDVVWITNADKNTDVVERLTNNGWAVIH